MDLFSGIGGFAIAAEEVWNDVEHIFCEIDPFCQEVLKKHWSEAEVWGDIHELIAQSKQRGHVHGKPQIKPAERQFQTQRESLADIRSPFLLTGGFPCQPFSHAGKRRGKADERFLWSAMLECIKLFKPKWVIAENVYGILSIEDGLVFEQVCSDMEKAGYEVWPFIVPACAVNAPHRRDRVWFVAHSIINTANRKEECGELPQEAREQMENRPQFSSTGEFIRTNVGWGKSGFKENKLVASGIEYNSKSNSEGLERKINQARQSSRFDREAWNQDWPEVAARLCRMDDGLPARVYGTGRYSESRHRAERLKALGNSIVPQVAVNMMKAIRMTEEANRRSAEG